MSINGALVLVFFTGIAGSAAVHSVIRSRVNQRLPPLLRVRFWEKDYLHLMKLHKEHYPDSPLRFWFWTFMLIAIGAWILGAYLQATAHR